MHSTLFAIHWGICCYSTYVLGSTAAATAIQAAYVVSAILSSFVVNFADRRLGHHKMMMIGAAIYIIGKVWFLFSPASLAAVYVNAISVGFGGTTAFVLFNTNRNNLVDLIEWQSGYRLDSMVSTMESLVSKLASAGAAGLITLALSLNGFNADLSIQPAAVIRTIDALIGWIPMLIAIIMLVTVSFLDIETAMNKMNEEKAAGCMRQKLQRTGTG